LLKFVWSRSNKNSQQKKTRFRSSCSKTGCLFCKD